jgi:hypothetical protein
MPTDLAKRHQRVLEKVFLKPTPTDLKWPAVVTLVRALGGTVDEGREGSRVAFMLGSTKAIVHKPHPGSELKRSGVRDVRDFLENAGVRP